MSFNQYNQFQRMEDPEDRKAEDIQRSKGDSRKGYKKKSTTKSVSLRTFRTGTGLAALLVWVAFLAAVSYGVYLIIQQFSLGG